MQALSQLSYGPNLENLGRLGNARGPRDAAGYFNRRN
jgi:hypothetical protein